MCKFPSLCTFFSWWRGGKGVVKEGRGEEINELKAKEGPHPKSANRDSKGLISNCTGHLALPDERF